MSDDATLTRRGPHPVDLHVGRRLRALRRAQSVTQERLAELLGVSFQQVQKYENGDNRLSASRLFETAGVLGISVNALFAGLDSFDEGGSYLTAAGRELDQLLVRASPEAQRLLVELAGVVCRGPAEVGELVAA